MRALLVVVVLAGSSAVAYERPLAFTLTSPTVEKGKHELLLTLTPRFGRTQEFVRFEGLAGFGYGVSQTIDAQVLLAIALESFGRDQRSSEGGGLLRVRWQPFDARNRVLGFNLQASAGLSPISVFFEGRIGLEKWLGDFLFAINATVDYRVRNDGALGADLHTEQTGGIVYRLANNFTVGFEVRSRIGFERGEYYGAAISMGPTLGWRNKNVWFSLAALPQVAAEKADSEVGNGEALELRDNERVVIRLQLGVDI